MFFMSNMSKIFRCLFSVRICTIFSPSSLSGTTIIYCLYYYSFSIHFRDHLAIILNVSVGFLSLLYLVLFSFGFGVIGFLSLLYPYYVLLLCRLLPVPNFSLFLFCLQKEQPSIPPCVFFCSSPSKLVSFLSTLCLSLFSLYFFLYFSSKINTSYSSHLSVARSTTFMFYNL